MSVVDEEAQPLLLDIGMGPEAKAKGRPKGSKNKANPMASKYHTPFKRKFPKGPNLIVTVTKPIMEHAKVRDSSHCMIAMAVRDVAPQMRSIAVDLQTIRFTDREKGFRFTYLTPRIAQVALIKFDQGTMPEAFTFRLAGAHVTRMMHSPKVQTPREMTEAHKRGLVKALEVRNGKGRTKFDKLEQTFASGGSKTERCRRVGGVPPPLSTFARRREFGLKGLRL